MAGYVNSWIEQYQNPPVTCANSTTQASAMNPWIWLLLGLVLGSLQFEKKHDIPKS